MKNQEQNEDLFSKKFAKESKKEALLVFFVALIYLLLWILSLFCINRTSTGLLYLPLWFEVSCIYLPILFCISLPFLIKSFKAKDFSNPQDKN